MTTVNGVAHFIGKESSKKVKDVPETNNNVVPLTQEKILSLPFEHILQNPGKKVRSKLIQAFNHWLEVPPTYMNQICEIIETLHNASLLIDDIEDNSVVRRGMPVAHKIYGVPSTINTANYMYFKALEMILVSFPAEFLLESTRHYTLRMLQLHRGQGMDIYWRDTMTCPSLEDYLEMIENKTTGLFGLALDLMRQFSSNKTDYSPLVRKMGEYFQIRDDYANLKFDEYAESKTFGEDLTEGKFSYPVIHAITNFPQDQTITSILRLKTNDVHVKKFAVQHLEKLGSLQVTSRKLQKLRSEIVADIERYGNNPLLKGIMEMLYMDEAEKKNTKNPTDKVETPLNQHDSNC